MYWAPAPQEQDVDFFLSLTQVPLVQITTRVQNNIFLDKIIFSFRIVRHKSSSRPFVYIFLYYSILPSLWYMSWKNYCDYSFQTICRPSVKTLDNGNVEPL